MSTSVRTRGVCRIEAARAARKFPSVLDFLRDGSITLTNVCLLAKHLTDDNCRRLLEAACHKSKREVEQQVATLAPKPVAPSSVRKLPTPKRSSETPASPEDIAVDRELLPTAAVDSAAPRPLSLSVVTPLAPERYKVHITITRQSHEKLRRVQDLLRHVVPNGDPAVIFERALDLLLNALEKRKLAKVDRPRAATAAVEGVGRYIPAAVRRAVWARDDGRCAFIGRDGRCAERGSLEFHHVVPFADGGPTTVENLQLRCRAHNQYEARDYFGPMLFRERPNSVQDRVASQHNSGQLFIP